MNDRDILTRLQNSWVRSTQYSSETQQRIWDRRAESFSAHPLPDMTGDLFLARMAAEITLDRSCRTLDVGCGAGGYSIALAEHVDQAVGVDISPNMIRAASERAASLGRSNCSFYAADWADTDIDELGLRNAFDVTFAHMTPAICDYASLDKLNACSRELCMLEKPTRRTNKIQDACFAAIGLPGEKSLDTDLINIFTYAWCKGFQPQLFYTDETWNSSWSADELTAWCTDRARLVRQLAPADEEAISSLLQGLANSEGIIEETSVTTRVTVIWHVNK